MQFALRWLLRSPTKHGKRTVLLSDAQVVRGAIAKGRSSAQSLQQELMRIAALQMAGDRLLKLIYVQSEDNPADARSRGAVRRRRQQRSCVHVSRKLVDKRERGLTGVRKQGTWCCYPARPAED